MAYEIIGRKEKRIPKFITSAKTLKTAINRSEKWLMSLERKYGIYENFGQGVVRVLEDKYIDSSSYTNEMNKRRDMLRSFNEWCMSYNG